jgi:hypothetical protein
VNTIHISSLDRALLPAFAGDLSAIAIFPVEAVHVECEFSPIIADSPVSAIDEAPVDAAQVLRAGSQTYDSDDRQASVVVLPIARGITTRQVRPAVKEFIKRVVVPILIERYISQMNSDTLLARTGGAS